MFDFSPIQIIIVLVIALVVLGPKRLPSMAKSLGHGLRGFRDSLAGNDEPDEHVDEPVVAVAVQAVEPPAEGVSEDEAPARLQAVEPVRAAV